MEFLQRINLIYNNVPPLRLRFVQPNIREFHLIKARSARLKKEKKRYKKILLFYCYLIYKNDGRDV